MDTDLKEALDSFLADIKTFQESPITADFPFFGNKLELTSINPSVFESTHKSRKENPDREAYGKLLRRLRAGVPLLFDADRRPITAAVNYIQEKAGIEFSNASHPTLNRARLKLNNGFYLLYFWESAYGPGPSNTPDQTPESPHILNESHIDHTVIGNYCVVEEYDRERFTKEVNALIQQGWQPLGGAAVCQAQVQNKNYPMISESKTLYLQSMVK